MRDNRTVCNNFPKERKRKKKTIHIQTAIKNSSLNNMCCSKASKQNKKIK